MSGEAFALERLREDPNLDYASLRRQAADAGVSMMPIQYGRARKQLGLPPLKGADAAHRTAAAANAERGDERRRGAATQDANGDADADADDRGTAREERGERDDRADVEPGADDAERADRSHDDGDRAGDGGGQVEAQPAAGDLVAPRRKGSAAFDFLVQELRREPHATYAELRDRCTAKGWKVAPIMYGRAKAVLGLVPVKPRGTGKKAIAAAAPALPRTLKQVESVAADRFSKQLEDVRNLDQLVAVVRELDAERRRLRELLDRIVGMIDEALG
jgi:hypothetical protein